MKLNSFEELVHSIDSTRFILEDINNFALILFDKNYKYHVAIGHALEFAGYKEEDLLHKTIHEAFPPEVVQRLLPMYEPVIAGNSLELPFTGNNNVDYFVKLRPIVIDKNVEGGILLIHHAKDFEHKLLAQFADFSNEGIHVADKEGNLIFANAIALKRLGLTADELKTKKVIDIEEIFETQADWDKHFKAIKKFKEIEVNGENKRSNGDSFPVKVTSRHIEFNNQEFIVASIIDISDKVDVEKSKKQITELEASLEFRKNFLSEISHELRTPLNGILGLSEHLINGGKEKIDMDLIATINDSANQLDNILDNTLHIGKIERGQVDIYIEPFKWDQFGKHFEPLFKQSAEEKGLELQFYWGDSMPLYIHSDRNRLKQVLNNLVSNAIKYTNDGVIQVRTILNSNHDLLITIEDNGIGMTPEELTKLEGMFTRFDNSRLKQKASGTGLGMWITKKIIDEMKGSISYESEKNVGTKITIELPIEYSNTLEEENNSKNNKIDNVYIVDDKPTNLKVAELLLSSIGVSSKTFLSGKELLAAEIKDSDLFFVDIQMPEMDGFEVLKKLKSKGIKAPIIALTANNYQGFMEEVKAAGFDGYLPKPISVPKIMELLSEYSSETD